MLLSFGTVFSQNSSAQVIGDKVKYPVISYLKIRVDGGGNLPENPYVIHLQNCGKILVAVGTQHTMDTTSQMFRKILTEFNLLKPEIVINEGGDLVKRYVSRNQAIFQSGELGLEKYLADSLGIKTLNGDMPEKMEFDELSASFSKDEALFYFATERFMFPYLFSGNREDLKTQYETKCISNNFDKEGIRLNVEERTFAYYKNLYRRYFGATFSIDSLQQLDFIPFATRGHFNDVSRKSKSIRDQYLLNVVAKEMSVHRKVLLIFGGWHILSIEPGLNEISKKCSD